MTTATPSNQKTKIIVWSVDRRIDIFIRNNRSILCSDSNKLFCLHQNINATNDGVVK